MSSGRKKDPIWQHFIEIKEIGKAGQKCECKYCGKIMQGIVERMKTHNKQCAKPESSSSQPNGNEIELSTSTTSTMDKFLKITKTTKLEKDNFDEQVSRFVFATNTSFRSVEHKEFVKMCQQFRPGYNPPNRKVLADKWLNVVYEKENLKCIAELKDKSVCLTLDGWSNIRNEPIICSCVINDQGNVTLVDTVDTSGERHTSQNLVELAVDVIKTTEKKFKVKVTSLVTDNAANMVKMRKDLEMELESSVICYGCSAHILNLLAGDFTSTLSSILAHVNQIIKYFRNHHLPKAWYTEAGGSALIIPIEVRWNTHCDSLESYLNNWTILAKVAEDKRDDPSFDKEIGDKIMNFGIKRAAQDIIKLLKPIAVALDKMQSNSCKISDAVIIWKQLELDLEENSHWTSAQKKQFLDRYTFAITSAHCAAFLMSPRARTSNFRLTQSEKANGISFMEENYNLTFMPMFFNFHGEIGVFNNSNFAFKDNVVQSSTDNDWWKTFQKLNPEAVSEKNLSHISQLMTAISSSAGVERTFSKFGLIHTKIRNQLGVEKAAKLVFVSQKLNPK